VVKTTREKETSVYHLTEIRGDRYPWILADENGQVVMAGSTRPPYPRPKVKTFASAAAALAWAKKNGLEIRAN